MKRLSERREHYYYVVKIGNIKVVKAYNKKQMWTSLQVREGQIIARYKHYDAAYRHAYYYTNSAGICIRPEYVSITDNDYID